MMFDMLATMDWLDFLKNVGAFAIASGLLAWLVRELVAHSLSRDLEAFKSELQKAHEEAKNRFTVGAMSHMATVAFDKHVQFCEEYASAVNGALQTMLRKGPHQDILEAANALTDIRVNWSIWLVPKVEAQLSQFESALRKIGANAWLLSELRADEDRSDAIKQAYGTFAAVMGWEKWQGEAVSKDLAAEKIIEGLRSVLGTTELTRLRDELVERAASGQ